MYDLAHNPYPSGATPTPTQAGRASSQPAAGEAAPAPGKQDPAAVYVAPPGVPFYQAAVFAATHGYASMKYPDPTTGSYATYSTTTADIAQYARNTGAQTALAQAAAIRPGARVTAANPADAFLGVPAQSVAPMGGNASSLLWPASIGTSPIHPYQGTGSVWATSLLHSGPAGGVPAAEQEAGGPPKGHPGMARPTTGAGEAR